MNKIAPLKTLAIRITFLLGTMILPLSSAHSQTVRLPAAGGSYVDPASGFTVWRLTDRALCPAGANHTYSDTWEMGQNRAIVKCRTNRTNTNIWTWKLLKFDGTKWVVEVTDIAASSKAPRAGYNYDGLQFIPGTDRILGVAYADGRAYEFDPWNGSTKLYGAVGDRHDWRITPQGGIVSRSNDKRTLYFFDGTTLRNKNVGAVAPNPDQPSALLDGRPLFTWDQQPHRAWNKDFSGEVVFDDFHGHLGQFRDGTGKLYTVDGKEDRLANGGLGQLGCPNIAWRPEMGIYDASTGKRVLIWGCDQPEGSGGWDRDHFATSNRVNWFVSSGHVEIVEWTVDWNARKVTRRLLAKVRRGQIDAYTGSPKVTSNLDGSWILWSGPMCDGTVLESDGSVKRCPGGSLDLDMYAMQVGIGSPTPIPTPVPTPTPTPTPTPVPTPTPIDEAPIVGLACPAQAKISLRCSFTVADDSGVVSVLYEVAHQNVVLIQPKTLAPSIYTFSVDVSALPRGTIEVAVVARDSAGQTGKATVNVILQ